jgi:hypothetical protein
MNIKPVTEEEIISRNYPSDIADSANDIFSLKGISVNELINIEFFTVERMNDDLDSYDWIAFDSKLLIFPVQLQTYVGSASTIEVIYPFKSEDIGMVLKIILDEFGLDKSFVEWIHPDLEKALLDELGNPDMPQLLRAK